MWNFILVDSSLMSPAEQVLYGLAQSLYRRAGDSKTNVQLVVLRNAGHVAMDALDAMQERRNSN